MIYDAVIIGGGPTGLMAAGQASKREARVLLLEKNDSLGRKLLMTGGARCNITNQFADDKSMISVYSPNAKFLLSVFHKYSVKDTLNFFASLGVDVKTEGNGRIFPSSNKANNVRIALERYLEKNKVEIRTNAAVKKIVAKNNRVEKIVLNNNDEVIGKNFIICTGGRSYPETGSTGEGYKWLADIGHTINKTRPALTPVVVKEKIVKKLEGLSLSNVKISIWQNKKNIISRMGEIIFTSDGISGPAIIDLSSKIGLLLPDTVSLKIGLQPDTETSELENKIQNDFHHSRNKQFKNYLASLVQPKLILPIIEMAGIDGTKQVSTINKSQRISLVKLLKEFTLNVKELKGFNKAMITAGGVDVKEIDPKTMRSRLYQNLFLAGEILDIDGPTGGYNLQICWSTGYVAGESVNFN